MARKRKADHETAIAGALELFWQKGYAGASTREIEEKTGLTRFTLQTAYGGKEKFFLETLDTYLDNAEARHFPDPARFTLDDLAEWFEGIASEEKIPRVQDAGCLAFNSISQFERTDPDVNARIERYLATLEDRFAAILLRAEEEGEVSLPLGAAASAQVLMGLLLGLHSVIKARTDDGMARSYAASAAGLLRSWRRAA
ncbi:TetR family transcriptional regulator [Shimia isoporae]|uniref:TetR family transcriptional regulator n=1 Tax=Shimia isoporae TaxID=647720 RepID=A0A4R1NS81_9RHOB|nr:TetR/AcrR family transcriptional regulator [Shimia isoporae]TCL08108.1 TetR family transcriptional regulator [Shimia isoporae]